MVGERTAAKRLATYDRKRDFKKTPEPRGDDARGRGWRYCIHKHAARRLHYDLRLEIDGALESWAVPRGPSLDPAEKRLAVHVEPHPLSYGRFEGVIPEGEYGGGVVLLWDEGTWTPEGDPARGLKAGKLTFRLHGQKLRGLWSLVRMKGRRHDGSEWLLIKKQDDAADTEGDLTTLVESVSSGHTLTAIGEREHAAKGQLERARRADRRHEGSGQQPVQAVSTAPADPPEGARRRALPSYVAPQLATLTDAPPEGDGWQHEIKYDGYRMLLRRDGDDVRILTRNEIDWTARLPWLRDAVLSVAEDRFLLDGELVHRDEKGHTDFGRLKAALSAKDHDALAYVAFDLLHHGAFDLRACPLTERQEMLAELLRRSGPPLHQGRAMVGHGRDAYEEACLLGLEGLIAKRRDASYRSGRSADWLKLKCVERQEFVIVGWTEPSGGGHAFGALLLAVHEEGVLTYAGRVGTGFDRAQRNRVLARLKPLELRTCPLAETPPRQAGGSVHWVRPEAVAEVVFSEWTSEGRLRHPSFKGLREDKPAAAIMREQAVEPPAPDDSTTERSAMADTADTTDLIGGVRLTHPDRVMYPEQGATKEDVARWYVDAADAILPFVAERPLALVRCPAGRDKECFFQKHRMQGWPKAIHEGEVVVEGEHSRILYIRDLQGLISLVQMGTLEVHVQGVRIDRPDLAERIVFDLDPAPDVAFSRVVEVARRLRDVLADMDLPSHPLATGGKGLHVVVPLARRRPVAEAKSFSKEVARRLVREAPDELIAQASKKKREGKIFIDYLRNGRGATAICPYSTRARPGAPIATPLRWNEVGARTKPDRYTLGNIRRRLAQLRGDPWGGDAA